MGFNQKNKCTQRPVRDLNPKMLQQQIKIILQTESK